MPEDVYRQAASILLLRPSCGRPARSQRPGRALLFPCGKIYQLLLLHKPRKRDAWQLPQGGVEAGETIEQAAVRELSEEAGVRDVEILGRCKEVYAYDFPASFRRFRPDNVCGQQITYVVALVQGDPKVQVDNKEIDNHVWVYTEELSRYIRRRKYLSFVQKLIQEAEDLAAKAEGS